MSDKGWWTQEEVTRITERIAELETNHELLSDDYKQLLITNERQQERVRELEEFIETIDHQYDAMQQIKQWCEAYPVDIFQEPDWSEVGSKLGSTMLSRVSASNMRHVVEGIKRIITECEKSNSQ
jgi:predicted nuclease with TOPRIM domain